MKTKNRALRWGTLVLLVLFLAGIPGMPALAVPAEAQPSITGYVLNGTTKGTGETNVTLPYVNSTQFQFGLNAVTPEAGEGETWAALLNITGGGINESQILSLTGTSVMFTPVNLSPNTVYSVKLTVQKFAGVVAVDGASTELTVTLDLGNLDNTAPQATLTSPANGSTGVGNLTPVFIQFTEANMDESTITDSTVTISPSASVTRQYADGDLTITPTSGWAYNTTYTVSLTSGIKDLAGNALTPRNYSFTTTYDPAAAPALTGRSPGANATEVAVGSNIILDFSRPVAPAAGTGIGDAVRLKKGTSLISVSYSYENGNRRIVLDPVASLENLTTYTVEVVAGKLVATDDSTKAVAATSWNFTTVAGASPVVTSRTPASGATNVPLDQQIRVVFSKAMKSSTLNTNTVYLTRSGSSTKISVSYSLSSDGKTLTLKPSSLLAADTEYQVTVTTGAQDSTSVAATADSWKFRTTRSSIVITGKTPAEDATGVLLDAVVKFKFSGNMQNSTVNESNIYLRKSGSSRNVALDLDYNTSTREVTLTPDAELSLDTTYVVYVSGSVRDSSGNAIVASNWSFTTSRNEYFRVTERDPDEGETGADVTGSLKIRFSRDVRESTMTSSSVYLREAGSTRNLAASLSYSSSNRTITLNPDDNLKPDTEYRVYLTTALKDTSGNALAATSWSFRTGREALLVQGKDPAPGSANVPAGKTVRFTFSRAVTSSTVTSSNIYLRETGGTTNIASLVEYDSSTRTVSLKPLSPLGFGKLYTVYVTNGVKDSYGNAIAGDSWSFYTVLSAPDPLRSGTATSPLVRLDGKYMTFTDARPYITNGTTMLPYRAIFEALGATVGYDNSNPSRIKITGSLGTNRIIMYIGEKTAYRNGVPITLREAPVIRNGRTMVPLRFVAESLGVKVTWIATNYNVSIETY